jgi:lipid II:glycine glycyltransferase (peptidoglycan interpeptide bridge formation enzyme)
LEAEEGRSRTLLMDLSPSLEDLDDALSPMWKRNLKTARKNNLDFVEGTSGAMFDDFISIYKEMKDRKGFDDAVDVLLYQKMQARLPDSLKMRVMLCKSETTVCSGLIYSRIGNTAIYLFGATSNKGRKSCGSYALHWNLVDALKKEGTAIYDLNGINPEVNPGTYRFKSDFAGKHGRRVRYVGRYDAGAGLLSEALLKTIEMLRTGYRELRQRIV